MSQSMSVGTSSRSNNRDERELTGWREELRDLMRGVTGRAIVGIPLLYTMDLIGEIGPKDPVGAIVGKVVIERAGVSIGISFANAFRGRSRTGGEESEAPGSAGSRYILPIEIANRGRRMLRDVQIEVRLRPPGGPLETREATIDTMGEGSLKRFYLYLTWPPGPGQVTVEPLSYRVE